MSAWKTATLGEIFDIARGGSPRPIQNYLSDAPDGVNWISISDASASDKFITKTKKRICPAGVSRSRMVKPGDFLLTNSMSFGRPYIMATSGCIHDGWLVLSSKHGEVDQDYFFHLLGSDFIYAKFTKLAAGVTVKNLNIDLVSGVKVSFPPLPEQRRIAAILDQADALRAKRREALAQLDSLTQSIFIEMFGDRANIPISTLGQVSSLKRGPFGGALKKEIFVETGHMVYEQRNAINNDCTTGRYFISESKFVEMKDFSVISDDLIVSCSGTLGKVAIVPPHAPSGIINQALLRVRVDTKKVTPIFVKCVLESNAVQRKLASVSHGTGLQNFPPMSEVKALEFPIPSLRLQQQFADRIQSVEKQRAITLEAATGLDSLFASLQHRAFQGEL